MNDVIEVLLILALFYGGLIALIALLAGTCEQHGPRHQEHGDDPNETKMDLDDVA
jgi:hypothetical protein